MTKPSTISESVFISSRTTTTQDWQSRRPWRCNHKIKAISSCSLISRPGSLTVDDLLGLYGLSGYENQVDELLPDEEVLRDYELLQVFYGKGGGDKDVAVGLDALDEVLDIAEVHYLLEFSDDSADYSTKLSLL